MLCGFWPSHYACLESDKWAIFVKDDFGRKEVLPCRDDEEAIEAVGYISHRMAQADDLDWFWEVIDGEAEAESNLRTRPETLPQDQEIDEINTDGYGLAYADQGCPVG